MWIFTYGALMWDPCFDFVEKQHAYAEGYSRKFCILSKTWRGTPEKPGLVAGLAKGGTCHGFAYKIAPENEEKAMPVLIIDSEGLGAFDEDENHDTKIFMLSLLM